MGQIMSEISDEDEGRNKLPPGIPGSDSSSDSESESESEPENHNLLLEKYELGKLVGHGAFGKVYKARDLRTGQTVAIKSVSKHRILNRSFVKREIHIMCRLRHPHIVRLHEVLATRTKIYSVMDLARGGELFTKITRARPFTEDLCRKYFRQLISAVGYCHSRGVFHRDLKPENLLLDHNWDLKVTDFGLSADQVRPDGMLHTQCGTPAYVAPEVLARKGYDGAKADLWSCGVILFAMSAGYLPFRSSNLVVMYRKISIGEFRCPRWTSPDLRRFLGRILNPNPSTRISMGEILRDPWFSKGGHGINIQLPEDGEEYYCIDSGGGGGGGYLNAFHLISYSSGADLSGLLSRDGGGARSEMFVSSESTERIIEGIVAVAEEEGVAKKPMQGVGVRLVAEDWTRKWNFVMTVEVSRLTPELAVVRVITGGSGPDFWEQKIKPRLTHLLGTPPASTLSGPR